MQSAVFSGFFSPLSDWQRHYTACFILTVTYQLTYKLKLTILSSLKTKQVTKGGLLNALHFIKRSLMSESARSRVKKQQAEAGGTLVPQIQLKQQSKSWKMLHNASKKNTKNTRGLKADISWRLCQLYFTLSTLFQGCGIFEINRVIFMKKRGRQCVIAVNRKKKTFWLVIALHILSSQDRCFPTAGTLAWDIFF